MYYTQNFSRETLVQITTEVQNYAQLIIYIKTNPKLSAYAILESGFNFNKTSFAPPGSKFLVYKDTKLQTVFLPHAKNLWCKKKTVGS